MVTGNKLQLWYVDDTTAYPSGGSGTNYRTFMVTSTDGINWTAPVQTDIATAPVIISSDVKYDPLPDNFVMFSTPYTESSKAYLERRIYPVVSRGNDLPERNLFSTLRK